MFLRELLFLLLVGVWFVFFMFGPPLLSLYVLAATVEERSRTATTLFIQVLLVVGLGLSMYWMYVSMSFYPHLFPPSIALLQLLIWRRSRRQNPSRCAENNQQVADEAVQTMVEERPNEGSGG